ncbi:hypothetical protein HOP62_08695 [Halomonas sp. MCCC 1A17488]|nr:hypothetical protein [Halomonas sp. MCCC 1A17488]MCG3239486.1 hypothetical protein [Halomonas sp. MCCC 1A17488]QPP50591.1 YdeI/OmpD-associated family protein [Halomonas sp. SS10-MC5]
MAPARSFPAHRRGEGAVRRPWRAAPPVPWSGPPATDAQAATLSANLHEAIELEKAGAKADFSEKHELSYPEELQSALERDPELKAAFEALTPGRKRGYLLHFSSAKQSSTRVSRIEKCIPSNLSGRD